MCSIKLVWMIQEIIKLDNKSIKSLILKIVTRAKLWYITSLGDQMASSKLTIMAQTSMSLHNSQLVWNYKWTTKLQMPTKASFCSTNLSTETRRKRLKIIAACLNSVTKSSITIQHFKTVLWWKIIHLLVVSLPILSK